MAMGILLTNDDGADSPLLEFLHAALTPLGAITIVVPAHEQSWTAKAMTRFDELTLERRRINGVPGYAFDGTPADCANLGMHHLCNADLGLVVSGINLGSNTGLGFVVSSGTVGACFEANLAGLPAVAVSQVLGRTAYHQWVDSRSLAEDERYRFERQTKELLRAVLSLLLSRHDFLTEPVTWNVNLPDRAVEGWKIIPTGLAATIYGSCFKHVNHERSLGDLPMGDKIRFKHEIDGVPVPREGRSDAAVTAAGHVSITRLDVRSLGAESEPPA